MKDIAERCGVSLMTVSRALRHLPGMSKSTAKRISDVAAEMGYDPSHHESARRMALRKHGLDVLNRVVAIFFPNDAYAITFFQKIFRGVMDEITVQKFGLFTTYLSQVLEEELLPIFPRGDVDGVILFGHPELLDNAIERLRAEPNFGMRPILSMWSPMPGCSAVYAENFGGAYASVNHLLDLGHKHILHFKGSRERHHPRLQRIAGAEQAYRERGIDHSQYLHLGIMPEGVPYSFADILPKSLESHPEVTAILSLNDVNAIEIRDILQKRGLRVPQDMSVVGFDDSDPMPDRHGNNILTTVKVPLIEIGRASVRLVIQRVTGEVLEDTDIVFPTSLIVRGSTAPPRS